MKLWQFWREKNFRFITGNWYDMDARQQILTSIREALKQPSHLPDETPREKLAGAVAYGGETLEEMVRLFKAESIAVSSECIEVASESEIPEKVAAILNEAGVNDISVSGGEVVDRIGNALEERGIEVVRPQTLAGDDRKNVVAKIIVGLVDAPYAIADTATLVAPLDGRSVQPYCLPEILIAVVHAKSLLSNHFELFNTLSPEERKNMVLLTGPSRTADIEKILIIGAHGPRRFITFLIR